MFVDVLVDVCVSLVFVVCWELCADGFVGLRLLVIYVVKMNVGLLVTLLIGLVNGFLCLYG